MDKRGNERRGDERGRDGRTGAPGAARPDRRAVLGAAGAAGLAACARPAPRDEADDALADLRDGTAGVEPVTAAERAARRARAARLLAGAGLDALVVEPGATLEWLAGVPWGRSERLFALVLLADGGHFWMAPAFELGRAEERVAASGAGGAVATWDEHEYAWRPLAGELARRGAERVAVEPQARAFVAERLSAALGRPTLSGADVVARARRRKDAHELALLERAAVLTKRGIAAAAERVREGMTSREIADLVRRAQERLGLTDVWVLALVGPAAAFPHGTGAAQPLARGDVLLVDTGGALHGYQSDVTRTWVQGGRPSAEVERVWHAVRDAQRRAFEAMRPGVPCAEIDRIARRSLVAAGFASGYAEFTHRLGHGIGLEVHEEPYLDGGNELPLEEGVTTSDEPGIYLPGRFGVRIEDVVAVTEDGARGLGEWQTSPARPG